MSEAQDLADALAAKRDQLERLRLDPNAELEQLERLDAEVAEIQQGIEAALIENAVALSALAERESE